MEKVYFKSEVILDESDINLLSEVVKDIHQQKFLYPSLKKIISSKSMKLCAIFLGKKIVSLYIFNTVSRSIYNNRSRKRNYKYKNKIPYTWYFTDPIKTKYPKPS